MKHRNRLTFPTIESFVKEEKKRVLDRDKRKSVMMTRLTDIAVQRTESTAECLNRYHRDWQTSGVTNF